MPRARRYAPSLEDALLAEAAIRIQLSPSNYALAVQRYNAIARFLDEHPALRHCHFRVAAQGSMAIGTTIAARGDEGFDIDVLLHIVDPLTALGSKPQQILERLRSLLEAGHWKGMTRLRRRCVTIEYADGMHLDLTPWIERLVGRYGLVFHHDPENGISGEAPSSPERFADWHHDSMPDDPSFSLYIAQAAHQRETLLRMEKRADVEPVPEQEHAFEKPRAVITQQLMKRQRNLRYAASRFAMPPSILLAKLVGETACHATPSASLLHEAIRITGYVLVRLEDIATGDTRDITNPRDQEESLLDRWPGDLPTVRYYQTVLGEMRRDLIAMEEEDLSGKRQIVKRLFGENVGEDAVRKVLGDQTASANRDGFRAAIGGLGGVATFGGAAPAGQLHTARPTRFYGAEIKR